ncbi:AMP-binding protein [Streptomyces sp. Da 82-17]|uniref:AMP-binding protein n=1 Tax=Streptomyces sp. Da 82-17 TaxID=3377116 RepID=UPI0038D41179
MPEPAAGALIHTVLARHAARTPDAPALLQGARRVTYGELDRAAEAYAGALRRLGVGPGTLVPVALARTPDLVAVLLGVLKCGAAYAALDPAWPRERMRTVVEELGPPVGVADDPSILAGLPSWSPNDPGDTDDATAAPGPPPPPPPPPTAQSPAAPATVFFTSGSSGRPKGVVAPHRAVTRLFRPGGALVGLGPGRVMAQAAPVPWDAFTLEVWGPLLTGAACAMSASRTLLPDELRGLIDRHGVDTLWITSSLFNLFVDEDPGCFTGLGHVLTGGEVLSPAHVRTFLRRHPGIALFNGYGPVESCVFATTHRITPADCDRPEGIPVGTPVPGTGVRLSRDGEILLSGTGLADGYLGLPEATAERFTTTDDGVRVYRTGDLGRLDADGVLHFHGRTDRQVKIAGHRVEPAETEAAARRVPGVRDCAALPVGDRLALYYTSAEAPGSASAPSPAAVRRALRAALPAHLVPHLVRELPALPVTAHGKVDRPALAALATEGPHPR